MHSHTHNSTHPAHHHHHRQNHYFHHASPAKPSSVRPANKPRKCYVSSSSIRICMRLGRGRCVGHIQSADWRRKGERGHGTGLVHTHVHDCADFGKKSSWRLSCSWVLDWLRLFRGAGEGVLRPGCGSQAIECTCCDDGGEGESSMRMCCFGCVLMGGIGEFMVQECKDCWILRQRFLQW
jgi:hypothetical protein